tara:strand:- start:176 stop:406 length:231 start_codon:yes stop_codon:yes gene_type:complete
MMEPAMDLVAQSDAVIIIGTSMQVYPAAGLMQYAREGAPIYFIDPNPSIGSNSQIRVVAEKATVGVPKIVAELKRA